MKRGLLSLLCFFVVGTAFAQSQPDWIYEWNADQKPLPGLDFTFQGVLILKKVGSSLNSHPIDGTVYQVGDIIGDGEAVYRGLGDPNYYGSHWADMELILGETYYYKLFSFDSAYSYSSGVETEGITTQTTPTPWSWITPTPTPPPDAASELLLDVRKQIDLPALLSSYSSPLPPPDVSGVSVVAYSKSILLRWINPRDLVGWGCDGSDCCSISSGIATLDTLAPGNKCYYSKGTDFSDLGDYTAEFRMKVLKSDYTDGRLHFQTVAVRASYYWLGVNIIELDFSENQVKMSLSGPFTYEMDTTDDFHVYRIVGTHERVAGGNYHFYGTLYIDGQCKGGGRLTNQNPDFSGVYFGDALGGGSQSQWDYIRYAYGAYPPPTPIPTITPQPTPTPIPTASVSLTPTSTLTPYGPRTPSPTPTPEVLPCGENMVYNGGFELWHHYNSVPDYWYDYHGNASWQRDDVNFTEGSYSAKVIYPAGSERLLVNYNASQVIENEQYVIKLWVLDNDADATVGACILWCREDGITIGESPGTNLSVDTDTWQELYAVTTAPAGATWVYPRVRVYSAAGDEVTINLDAVTIFNPCQPIPTPTPLPLILGSGDYNGDGTSDVVIFRPRTGLWAIKGLTRLYFGIGGDQPVSGDYNGDGMTNIAVFRGDSGLWSIKGITRTYFGNSSDIPVPGDYDRDGACDIGIFRRDNGLWAIRNITRIYHGGSNGLPVPGDYNGDGSRDMAVFNQEEGRWVLRGITTFSFGTKGDRPLSGDYNGDGIWECWIFRPSSGLWMIRGVTRMYFGSTSDQPISADYDGDASDDIGIFRNSSGLWGIQALSRVYFGAAGDIPVTR